MSGGFYSGTLLSHLQIGLKVAFKLCYDRFLGAFNLRLIKSQDYVKTFQRNPSSALCTSRALHLAAGNADCFQPSVSSIWSHFLIVLAPASQPPALTDQYSAKDLKGSR